MKAFRASLIVTTLLLVSCGTPDASGIYVASTGNEVAMIQLVQAQDGKLTGRIEAISLDATGTLHNKDADVDGSVSGHDFLLRPASVWFGGVQASGSFTGSKLTISGNGETLEAQRSSLVQYQEAVIKLKTTAGERRMAVASQQAQERIASTETQVADIGARLRDNTSKLNDALSRSPNFGQLAAANTAKIERMVRRAPSLNDLQRSQLGVAANQVEVETNQIEVARSQYAIGLNDLVDTSSRLMGTLDKLCTNPPAPLGSVCSTATKAATDFKAAVERGRTTFTPYKQKVQFEMDKQNKLSQRIG